MTHCKCCNEIITGICWYMFIGNFTYEKLCINCYVWAAQILNKWDLRDG